MPGALHPVADLPDERLVVGRREDVVVEDVRHRRRQVAVVLRVRLLVGLLQEVELELGAEHRLEARRSRPLDLRLQHLPRRGADRRAVLPGDVAEHERRPFEPRHPPQRPEVGPQVEVAVAPLPARHRVPGLRVHLHVEREQVVAALEPVVDRSSRKYSPCSRLPSSRPCMSVNAATTVSIAPVSTSRSAPRASAWGKIGGAPSDPAPRRRSLRRSGCGCRGTARSPYRASSRASSSSGPCATGPLNHSGPRAPTSRRRRASPAAGDQRT